MVISDDCSTDNTVKICEKWIEQNKDRFVNTQVVVAPTNRGISANYNQADASCTGEWVKEIAGDDLLLPECIAEYINYVQVHKDACFVFSKAEVFGSKEMVELLNSVYDYSLFNKTADEQHQQLLRGNCIPSVAFFFNKVKAMELNIKADERIPFLEDWQRWLLITSKGMPLCLVDKYLVRYRVGHSESYSTAKIQPLAYWKSWRLTYFYCCFPELYKKDSMQALEEVVAEEVAIYNLVHEQANTIAQIRSSYLYRIGKKITRPFTWLKRLVKK